jgi:hypothetical protein
MKRAKQVHPSTGARKNHKPSLKNGYGTLHDMILAIIRLLQRGDL